MANIPIDAAADRELLGRWLDGDGDAYAEIVRRHGGLVHRACQRQLGASDADDAAQAVFLVLLGKPRQALRAPVLEAWLLAVTRRVCANAARARRRRAGREETIVADLPEPSAPLPAALPLELLDAALADLPAHERAAIIRHYLGGVSQADIARADGCPDATIRARVHRGLERLRGWFRRRGLTTTVAALAAVLAAEGQAAEALSVSDPTTGAGAAAPSANAHAWSHTTMRQMTMARILPPTATVSALALASACWLISAAEPATVQAAPTHTAPEVPPTVVWPPAPTALAPVSTLLQRLPDGCRQVIVINLPDLHAVIGSVGGKNEVAILLATDNPALGRTALLAKAERGDSFVPSEIFPFLPNDPKKDIKVSVASRSDEPEHVSVTASEASVSSLNLRWKMTGADVAVGNDEPGDLIFRWLPDGCLMVAPTGVIDLRAANAKSSVLRTLAQHPDDAWFQLAGENLGEGLTGAHGWIRPTASGGAYEFRVAGVSDTAPAAAQLQTMLGFFAKQAADGLRPMLQPYVDQDPNLTSQRQALVDGFIASADTALSSARVAVDQGDIVIRGTTDAAALEAHLPVLLNGIQ